MTMKKIKIPIPLTTFTVVAMMSLSLMSADIVIGDNSADNSHYYWNNPLERQYGSSSSYEDTSPNLANFMTSPGVAAALFFSTAGALASIVYTEAKCSAQLSRISTSEMNIKSTCEKVRTLLSATDLTKTVEADFTQVGSTTADTGTAVTKAEVVARLNLIEEKINGLFGQTATTFSCPT